MDKYLIAGLGNPGPKYELTRHNIGFLALDQLHDKHGVEPALSRLAETAKFRLKNKMVYTVKPQTYMNLSGKAIHYYMEKEHIPLQRILVVTDDLALPFGKLRLKTKGSSGGHNGLKDIESRLATSKYPRLRLGIGSDFGKGQQVDYVLEPFPQEEMDQMSDYLGQSIEVMESFVLQGAENTMNHYN